MFDQAWKQKLQAAQDAGCVIELLGKISSGDLIRQIGRASVVVLPSLFDEFSRALVEALVLGRPVVTTETVGAARLVHSSQAGMVVPARDGQALAEGMAHVLGNIRLFTDNAAAAGPRLAHELSPRAIALQMVRHMAEIVAP